MTGWAITSSDTDGRGWPSSSRRRSCSRRSALGVIVRPRQPFDARSRTAQTSDRQLCSPGSRPMTLTLRRVSSLSRYRDNDDYAEQVIMPRSRWAASLSVLTGLSTGRYSA